MFTTVSRWCHEAHDTVHPVPAQLALRHGHLDLPARRTARTNLATTYSFGLVESL